MLGRMRQAMASFSAFLLAGCVVSAVPPDEPQRSPRQLTTSRVDLNRDGRLDRISLVMTKGRRFVDAEAWCGGMGAEKLEGDFAISVHLSGRPPVSTNLNRLFGNEPLWFGARPWTLKFADLNHDGRPDFTIGQYAGCSGWAYRVFTVSETGEVRSLPVPHGDIWTLDRANSSAYFHLTANGFRVSRQGRSASDFLCAYYRWEPAAGFALRSERPGFCPEDDPDQQAP